MVAPRLIATIMGGGLLVVFERFQDGFLRILGQ
jgi:hypothetical protein